MGLSKLGIASRRVWGGAPALALCALLVSMAAAHAVDPPAGRIIGGSETTTEKWPWQAALTREGVFACGGSLISPDIVLTAAHCAQDPNGDPTPSESLRAVFGLDDLSDESDPDAFAATVRESFISPQFEPSRLGAGFDFALLLLDAPLGRAPIDLATGADGRRFDEHDKVLTTGWGLIDGNPATNTSVLHQGDVRLVDCSSTFGFSDSLLFCSAGGDGSCFGDSGGPLMIKTGPGTFRQIGISSFSDVSCEHMHAWTNVVDGPVRRALDEGIATLRSLPPAQPGPADGDSTAPQTKITKAPKAKIRTRKRRVAVTIKFRASEPSTFKCSLDGKRPRRCSSPLGFRVRKGPHRFQVFATDTAGNADPIPDTAGWRVKRIR